jgi:signal transduction histidine kinase
VTGTRDEKAQPAQTRRRPAGVAVLAIPLLAVLVLAGVGTAASLRDGARAERVRGLAPFTAALTTLVHHLQRERSLSVAGQERGDDDSALEVARRAVDRAAAAYRDAAVRVDISDRDRRLHQRLDAGLAELAGLAALRASVDGSAAAGDPEAARATVFRSYTAIVGGLLAVGAEIGLHEAGQDAGLQRAVGAASVFSRALELADREREAAAEAMAGVTLDPAERARLAALGGRQDALLDQFGTLASPGQLQAYGRSLPAAEVERAGRLRRAALEGGPGADPAGWSRAATTRVDRMGEVERRLAAEVTRLAALAERTADRRALAYGGVFLLTACAVAVLMVLAPGRARRAREDHPDWTTRIREAVPDRPPTADVPEPHPLVPGLPTPGTSEPHRPLPGPPDREGSPGGAARGLVVHSPHPGSGELEPGLADLAKRSQELADQQLELLDQTGRDQADPRLPGRLLQLDRLAVRARRNAHNLIVLSGGEPSRRWDGPAPLAEVAAVAVLDNPDAPRVGVNVPDELLVPGPAADDLANLLAELVDNATAFSAPETRVEVRGQKVGSGYVLEVEDQGLGMTDGELEAVNRRLAGDPPAAADDPGQGLGTWVAGRLARRHGVRVQLRRSPSGGVTALVFFPERLTIAPEPAGPPSLEPPPPAEEGEPAPDPAAVAGMPLRRYVTQDRDGDRPLPRRAPHASLAPDLAAGDPARPGEPGTARSGGRSPEQVRNMLTRYRSGLERGRAAAARDDLPDDPDGDPDGDPAS